MAAEAVRHIGENVVANGLIRFIAAEGSVTHRYVNQRRYQAGIAGPRSLADAVHNLSAMHGVRPGVVDLAAERAGISSALEWLDRAVVGFVSERTYLTQLVVAAGPMPSTPGHAQSEAAVIGQRHALEMLAQSDRIGCALGAAIALVEEWRVVRHILDASAARFGVTPPPVGLPDHALLASALMGIVPGGGVERALRFGAQQIIIQHRGHWDLLEARIDARRDT